MKDMKFEDMMKRLQEIVGILEKGELDIDESIRLYEEGLGLSKELKKQLLRFEKQIEELSEGNEEEDDVQDLH